MVTARAAGHDDAMPIPIPSEVFLCDYERANGRWQLWALLDELTLTYSVVVRSPDESSFTLRRHLASMREARTWADGHRDRQAAVAGRASDHDRGHALRRTTREPRCRA
jgi:hypothetical protein